MDAEWITALVIGMGLPILIQRPLMPVMEQKLWHKGMRRINFRGTEIVTAGGLVIVFSTIMTGVMLLLFLLSKQTAGRVVQEGVWFHLGIVSMAFWGWLDDASLEKEIKGFRGHFGALWRERKMTSGLWKVWGGGSTAMLIAYGLTDSFWSWLLGACVIAVSSNLLNLFDLRPARAIKVFWLILLLGMIMSMLSVYPVSYTSGWLWLLPIFISTILMFRHDAGGKIMLGDTGANVLGFAAGFALVQGVPWQGQAVLFILFLFLQVASEFVSFSQIIAEVKWLKRIDSWGRSAEAEK
ncbi:UDP-N-acetylmuramyl pentapeptide phosphotransferase [Brevibacillus sp. AY1]|uniref:UDP-N-acetylmuramyl pentapeptide phosphotransferase n=1 Tax=Brevibacillus sp. AY1 TaxID=2807621 RepID=UPI002453A664|nr:UDP-N-acetylmuramyl pentapeptide phosphotransferase [Brevibacillus sp. AY1]MDH4615912.1 UDP-N-acetylmuramyl pentapeptide phosphotransferase [Brevibacillus sp. AY1]